MTQNVNNKFYRKKTMLVIQVFIAVVKEEKRVKCFSNFDLAGPGTPMTMHVTKGVGGGQRS